MLGERQLDGIELDRTFIERASGRDRNRPQLDAMLAYVREGDTVLVHSMDRLARNLDDLRSLVRSLTAKGVAVHFVKEQLTFTGDDSPMATLLLSVMGAFAEFERSLHVRTRRGGVSIGPPCENLYRVDLAGHPTSAPNLTCGVPARGLVIGHRVSEHPVDSRPSYM
jgi:DNA invertase Pin-like site-specific DNA recombinase